MTNIDKPTILVVEDETIIRMVIAEELLDSGYRVLEAANGEEALLLLDARPDVKVVVTDVKMPGGIDGFALARLAAKTHPGVGIVIASGHADPAEDRPEDSIFVHKPYRAELIAMHVEQLLRTQGEGGSGPLRIAAGPEPIALVAETIVPSGSDGASN